MYGILALINVTSLFYLFYFLSFFFYFEIERNEKSSKGMSRLPISFSLRELNVVGKTLV
jgi:hypothetical protein